MSRQTRGRLPTIPTLDSTKEEQSLTSATSELNAAQERFQALTKIIPLAILHLNKQWECIYRNDIWYQLTEISPKDCKGQNWLKSIYDVDRETSFAALKFKLMNVNSFEGELRLQSSQGKISWMRVNACCLYDSSGETSGYLLAFSDITDHLSNIQRLQEISKKDQLTGLVNRAFFRDRIDTAIKGIDRYGSVALMIIDLDEFKHINDTLGHNAGDQVLKEVANRLKRGFRQVDSIARIGGDEFTILFTNVNNIASISAIASKLVQTLVQPFTIEQQSIYITSSIGISVIGEAGVKSTEILRQANSALFKAKKSGKNQYKFYTAELDKHANLHLLLLQSLKELSRCDFRLVYQPQVNAVTGAITGLEALTRWEHKSMEPTSTEIYIKMIEESGLINEYFEWLLDEALTTINQWNRLTAKNPVVPVSINLSAKQFRNLNLANDIYQRCLFHNIAPHKIVFEVTETAFIDEPEIATQTLRELKSMGFKLALDDFGTGYSSLIYLKRMPFDTVKIDRSFIKDITFDQENGKIVEAIISLAKTLDLSVIAEGVDNPKIKNWLIDHNCPFHQGFLYHKPMNSDKIVQLLKLGPSPSNKTHDCLTDS